MLAFVILLSTFFPSSSVGFLLEESLTLGNLFSVSCEFSTFVSRSKRSVELSDDPAEMFRYLFPLADVQPEQFMVGGARSNSVPNFASYFDDLVDLWHEECAEKKRNEAKAAAAAKRTHRRRKRSQVRNQGAVPIQPQHTSAEPIAWTGYLGNLSSTWYTYMPTSEEQAPEHTEDSEDIEDEEEERDDEGDDGNHHDNDSSEDAAAADDDDDDEEDPDDEDESRKKSKKKKKKNGMTTTTTEATTTTASSGIPSIAEQDPNFASYGGDIEYVLPILSCTIPFDGEITALGFHGFKGMFIY